MKVSATDNYRELERAEGGEPYISEAGGEAGGEVCGAV